MDGAMNEFEEFVTRLNQKFQFLFKNDKKEEKRENDNEDGSFIGEVDDLLSRPLRRHENISSKRVVVESLREKVRGFELAGSNGVPAF